MVILRKIGADCGNPEAGAVSRINTAMIKFPDGKRAVETPYFHLNATSHAHAKNRRTVTRETMPVTRDAITPIRSTLA